MKNDLATAIIAAVASVIISYFICNMFLGRSGDFSFNTVDDSVSSDLATPDPELFNYQALNPTVEVYVGNCTEINMYGECIDESSEQIEEGIIEGTDDTDNAQPDSSPNNQRNDDNGVTD